MSITVRTPHVKCANCVAFEAEPFSTGSCKFWPQTVKKEEDDWCLQFTLSRIADTSKKPEAKVAIERVARKILAAPTSAPAEKAVAASALTQKGAKP